MGEKKSIMQYVCGFAFNSPIYNCANVYLVQEKKPAWQFGKYNGVGGRIESYDKFDAYAAMHREFYEETGVALELSAMNHFLTYDGRAAADPYFVKFFSILLTQEECKTLLNKFVNDIGERMAFFPAAKLPDDVIHNLRWLIPYALDACIGKHVTHVQGI